MVRRAGIIAGRRGGGCVPVDAPVFKIGGRLRRAGAGGFDSHALPTNPARLPKESFNRMPIFPDQHVALLAAAISFGIPGIRWLYFSLKLWDANRLRDEYMHVLYELSKDQQDNKRYDKLAEVEARFARLFKQSNSSPTGFILRRESEIFGEFGPSPSVVKTYLESFHSCIGYFRARRNEARSPVFWLESLFNWPKTLLGFLGFETDSAIAKILQLLVFILEIAGALIAAANSITI